MELQLGETNGMQVNVTRIYGRWNGGYALDKHLVPGTFPADYRCEPPIAPRILSDAGKALHQLNERADWSQTEGLAQAIASHICPLFDTPHILIPMPASNWRPRQPVAVLTASLGEVLGLPVFRHLLSKTRNGEQLKTAKTREERDAVLADSFFVTDCIHGDGPHNAVLVDDFFETGASLEAACAVLRGYPKIGKVYVATVTKKGPR